MKKFIATLQWKQLYLLLPALVYGLVYLIWFGYVEKTVTTRFTIIHTAWDEIIPFLEIFIIPYILWFPYVMIAVFYFCLTDKNSFVKCCLFLFTGMTIFLIISTLFPNGHQLRPAAFARDNIFTQMIAGLYAADTPTNIVPSIHVYNSMGIHIAVSKCNRLKKHWGIRIASLVLCVSIILSTMFIKQHSVFDVITAFLMAGALYPLVYALDYRTILASYKSRKRKEENV